MDTLDDTVDVDATAEDPAAVQADEIDEAGTGAATEGSRPARSWLRRALAGAIAAAFLALAGALGYTLYQQSELQRLQSEATATTRDYLTAMASFDYQNLDANKGTITERSTPEFAKKYDEMVAALRDIVVTSKGVAAATAEHVAVEQFDGERATVVGFVDQQVTNVTAPQGNKQRYRMVVSLVRDGDRWLVDDVKTL
ncbi:hypothetical protein A5727_21675 [Mycobacterium sp. ACS4331]|nr:hypothetical protein A5727_21675 [Mycobacterium sp. ACS4331]